ncbi:hypothetical protein BX600DRAFT_507452 [Xylariales sp. PMI_506]|nr:hypothetical protein BX600DRAFT_507452 [Xylariales sp. PMI_506]
MASTNIISTLKDAFRSGQVLVPGTPNFEEINGAYLSLLESEITPSAIFQPKTKEDVAKFIQVMKSAPGARFAIRGAGQQPLPGCANIEGGITVDLSLLTGVEINEDGTVSIAAGERWGTVVNTLWYRGLAVVSGRTGKGGIGGLALAGGLSYFSSREGFICDNVINFEVVLASGEIVQANAFSNPDLWKTLRGGSNNFGIVTRYDMATFKQGKIWGGNIYYPANCFANQVDALVNELSKPTPDNDTAIMLSIGYAAQLGVTLCLNTIYYTREVAYPEVLKPFITVQTPTFRAIDSFIKCINSIFKTSIMRLNSLRIMTLPEAADLAAASAMNGIRAAYMNTTIKADAASLRAAADIYTSSLPRIKDCKGLVGSFTLQPYPVSLLQRSLEKGGNVLGLDPTNGPVVSVLLLTYWKNKYDDPKVLEVMRDVLEMIKADAVARKTAVPFTYLNYSWDFQDPIGSYGEENKKLMQAVSCKFDPDGLFQKACPGGFKLFA